MSSRKTIFLAGAGAVLPWNAPSTWAITQALREDTVFKSTSGHPLGDWLYQKLTAHYSKNPETVNFETLLNALDYLMTFFTSRDFESVASYKNLLPTFFLPKDDMAEIISFGDLYEKRRDQWSSNSAAGDFYSNWNSSGYFFQAVYRRFTNLIIRRIQAYEENIHLHETLNSLLQEFISSSGSTIRYYTTNYDRLVPLLHAGDFFEGFTEESGKFKFDAAEVLTDVDRNVYYNLHGSVHYALDFPGNVQLAIDKFIVDFGSGSSSHADQDGKILYHSNIISGFNKSARILHNPYSQFFHRFYQDLLEADQAYLIGYSFGDIHLNAAIKNAFSVNTRLQIVAIDYWTFPSETLTDEAGSHDWLISRQKKRAFINPKFHVDRILGPGNSDRIKIYRMGFEKFLTLRQWTAIPSDDDG